MNVVVIVDIAVIVYAVCIDVEMQNTTLAVTMK